MKSVYWLMGTALAGLLAGCASTPVVLAPVGPNPAGVRSVASTGTLQVFSSLTAQNDDQMQSFLDEDSAALNPSWNQHTDYKIYTLDGKLVKRVDNTIGHYAEAPRRVALPPGRYLVKAQAQDYSLAEVPVKIERGRTTRVHLDDQWKPLANAPNRGVVTLPNGNPVGWRD
ncbi:MAG: hypothetical protein JWQ04_2820 [Pedosphaera sp.]|nr:hypothetical protein [Pedosphaera sp.]